MFGTGNVFFKIPILNLTGSYFSPGGGPVPGVRGPQHVRGDPLLPAPPPPRAQVDGAIPLRDIRIFRDNPGDTVPLHLLQTGTPVTPDCKKCFKLPEHRLASSNFPIGLIY